MDKTESLLGREIGEIEAIVRDIGGKPYRAKQVYHSLYARGARSYDEMTDLPGEFRLHLSERFPLGHPRVARVQESGDGTRKYVLEAPSGGRVEAVFMPELRRVTLCISSQIGCALDCKFCLTARLGLERNLAAGEIVGQVLTLLDDNRERIGERPVNVVMMGMGEPLHNYDGVVTSVRLLCDPEGMGIPRRRVTLSTAGWVTGIRRLAKEEVRPRLAISLNATTDPVRTRLMPVNRKFPIATLLEACREYPLDPRERLTFEYVLLKGINDAPEDPARLAGLLRKHRLRAKVNLIPFNAGGGLGFEEPTLHTARRFREELVALGIPAFLRKNRGRDISAACGQLALVG